MDKDNQLQRLHEVLLEILTEFDRICRKHNIQYFLDSGTALGAVRHGGFIPWDDDIDVGMLRSEYDRFMEVAPKEIGEKFYLQHRGVEPNYMKDHAKLRMLGTYYPEKGTDNLACQGIFIDIFPFDNISDGKLAAKFDFFLTRYFRSRVRIRRYPSYRNNHYKRLLGAAMSLVPVSTWDKIYYWSMTRLNKKDTNHVACYLYKMCINRNIIFKKEWIYPSKTIQFERREFLIMNDYDKYLIEMYHDYMQLPPVEKRIYHTVGDIAF